MAFTLRISVSGLCLFVPQPMGSGGRMHVLMPVVLGDPYGPEDRHVPAVVYDAGTLVRGGPFLDVPVVASLTDCMLPLGGGDTALPALSPPIVDLTELTGRSVDPNCLGADTRRKLLARVTLHAGGAVRAAAGACWEMRPGEIRPVAHQVEWEIPNVPGDSLALVAGSLRGGGMARDLGTLYPSGGLLSIGIMNGTPQEMPPEPERRPLPAPGERARHFGAFYGLLCETTTDVIPRYAGTPSDAPPREGGFPELPLHAAAFACSGLLAGANAVGATSSPGPVSAPPSPGQRRPPSPGARP